MKGETHAYAGRESSPRKQPIRDLGWLGAALALHAVLIFLPLGSWKYSQQRPISIELSIWKPANNEPQKESIQREAAADIEPRIEPEADSIAAPTMQELTDTIEQNKLPSEPVQEQAIITSESSDPAVDSKILRRAVEQAAYARVEEKPGRQLGDQPDYKMPGNWKSGSGAPYLAEFENTFNGMTAPADVEIVDRWQAADGSHRVVLNLPNGDIVCGRAEANDPMQPLVEHIMLFGPCGGGGKRTFTMPHRENQQRPQ